MLAEDKISKKKYTCSVYKPEGKLYKFYMTNVKHVNHFCNVMMILWINMSDISAEVYCALLYIVCTFGCLSLTLGYTWHNTLY